MIAKILFVGHGRCGKDTAARTLHGKGPNRFGGSTSWHALPFMAEYLNVPPQIAWDERHENRVLWWEKCNELREADPLFLIRRALKHGNICTGIRDRVEIDAAKSSGLFSSILWIDRPGLPEDPTVKFTKEDCTDVLTNDSDVLTFRQSVLKWATQKGYIENGD